MSKRVDIVIIGAGLSGCATAQALALADLSGHRRILLVDRYQGVHPRFSGELIHPRGAQVLDDLGLHRPLVAAGAVEVDGFTVYEHADGRHVELPYAKISGQRPRGISVHHKLLVRVLRSFVAQRKQVELLEGWSVVELLREGERVVGCVLADKHGATQRVVCDLLVAADGKGSTVRKLAGLGDGRETIGFTAGIEVARAHLPAPAYAHVFLGPWGPILAYPILTEPERGLVTRITFDLPRELPAKGKDLVEHLFHAYLPYIPAPLCQQVADAILRHRGPLEMAPTVNLPAPPAVLAGLALVGDAAGCSHPITASGMTMGLRDAENLGQQARRRSDAPWGEPWLDAAALRRYAAEHDRYVPTRQALADAVYEAFRGNSEGSRAIRRALFAYWESDAARQRSMALLSCAEGRPQVFLSEYLKTARHAVQSCILPRHAKYYPLEDRLRQVRGAIHLAGDKLGLVAEVMWAQVRPAWLPRRLGQDTLR